MPECFWGKLPALVEPPRTLLAYHAAVCAAAALNCDDLVIGTGSVGRNYMHPLLRHGGGLYPFLARSLFWSSSDLGGKANRPNHGPELSSVSREFSYGKRTATTRCEPALPIRAFSP